MPTDTQLRMPVRTAKQERDRIVAWLNNHAEWHMGRAAERRAAGHTYSANEEASRAGLLGHHAEVIGMRLHHDSAGPERGER